VRQTQEQRKRRKRSGNSELGRHGSPRRLPLDERVAKDSATGPSIERDPARPTGLHSSGAARIARRAGRSRKGLILYP
jgi:hypothetical protein